MKLWLLTLSVASRAQANSCFAACPAETGSWDGDFGLVDFCSCNFGDSCPYTCGGGGPGTDGGFCSSDPCSTGQYSFDDDRWQITVTKDQAGGMTPYRAFAYLPWCFGKANSCVGSSFSFSVSFKTEDLSKIGAYVKLLFWTDSGNILGLLPPGAPGGKGGAYRLIAFPKDDYPNQWAGEVQIEDDKWYDAKVSFSGGSVAVSVAGQTWTNSNFGVDISGDRNGPQLGVYGFDFGGQWSTNSFKVVIGSVSGPGGNQARHDCEFQCLNGGGPSPPVPPTPSPSPTPSPPSPAPVPSDCPGGSLQACLADCPSSSSAYALCVEDCLERCDQTPSVTTTPAPSPPGGICCYEDCATLATCLQDGPCSSDESSCSGCSGIWCPSVKTELSA